MEYIKLGDICEIKTGKLDANASSQNGKYPFFTCSKEPLKIDTYSYDFECVLVAGNGDLNVKYYNGKFDAYQRTYIIKVKNKKMFKTKYIYLLLESKLDELRNKSIGGVIKYIKLGDLTSIDIPNIPIEEQEMIIARTFKLNNLIQLKKNQVCLLEELIKCQFIDMFGDPVTNNKKFDKFKLFDRCEIVTGNTPSRKIDEYYGDFIEWIKSDNIYEDSTYLTKAKESLSKKGLEVGRFVDKGSILMTCIAGSLKSIGNVAITDRKVSFNQQINGIVPKDNNVYFMYEQFILSKEYLHTPVNMSLKGILSKNQLGNLEFIFPPIELQNKFGEIFKKIEKQKREFEESLNKLKEMQFALMQEYFG